MGSQYWILTLNNVNIEVEDVLTSYLFDNGAGGVQENLSYTQLDRTYQPKIIESDIKSLIVYFEQPIDNYLLQDLKVRFPSIDPVIEEQTTKDWLQEWKDQWKPFCLVDDLWIVPDWYKDSFDQSGKKVIYIEPGMAFGTGTHETTQIASHLILDLLKSKKIKSAVDVGTGSGILAILLGLHGIQDIFAYDNDVESKRVFLENLEKNDQRDIAWVESWSKDLSGKVHLTIANIIDGVLLNLKPQFQFLESQYYIFTGILAEREEAFVEEMTEGWNLKILSRLQKGEWVGFCFEAQK